MLYEDYGKYGYESKYVLGDINIMCSMQEHLGVLLELKGRGCRQMESYLLAQERSWYDFMLDCMTAGGVMKRLDLAINDRVGLGAERARASAGSRAAAWGAGLNGPRWGLIELGIIPPYRLYMEG